MGPSVLPATDRRSRFFLPFKRSLKSATFAFFHCSSNPIIPAKAGIQKEAAIWEALTWIPAFAGIVGLRRVE